MRKIWFGVLVGVSTLATGLFAHMPSVRFAIAQPANSGELYYYYFGQKISLTTRPDLIAVKRSEAPKAEIRGGTLPFYLELQQELEGNATRGDTPIPNGTYQPLRENYTLIDLRNRSQSTREQTKQKLQQSKTIDQVLTVLTRPGMDEAIVVPNEIIVSFDSQLSHAQIESILNKQGLEMIQVLSSKSKIYLAKSRTAPKDGMAILDIANQLHQVQGVESATPNFIQVSPSAVPDTFSKETKQSATPADIRAKLPQLLANLSSVSQLQWYLDSSLLTRCDQQQFDRSCVQSQTAGKALQAKRTDIYAPEAWKQGNGGRGVVVAVMDSLIQWDHPDLQGNLYTAKAEKRCSGEIHGWDFYSGIGTQSKSEDICATGDPDTRISAEELNILRPYHQTAFSIPDSEILKSIPSELNATFKGICQTKRIPDCNGAIIRHLADQRESFIAQSFHGTSVAGVIAAQSPNQKGLTGIAPSSQVLPIRVGGFSSSELGISVDSAAVIKGLDYAEQRNVDIINMSFGGGLPIQNREKRIQKILQDNPKLVIVASTGNGRCKNLLNQVMYPAASEGVLAVGATNLSGSRACYSHYGSRLDLVAPGGDSDSPTLLGGILTTGGTFVDGFWQGIRIPSTGWGSTLDPRGAYVWIDGTSFSSPAVAGVLALMKAEDPQRKLTRQQLITILKKTASYDRLTLSPADKQRFQTHKQNGDVPNGVSPEQYFFGSGLVNAEAAVREVKRQLGK